MMSEYNELWFDVGIKRYTTIQTYEVTYVKLWFDVGIKRYTTPARRMVRHASCGLM